MTPSFARSLADSDWATRIAPKAIKKLLAVCKEREPRGLLLDVIKLVASFEELDEARLDAVEHVEMLEEKLEDRIELEKMLNDEIDGLRETIRELTEELDGLRGKASDLPVKCVDVLSDTLKELEGLT